MKYELNEEDVTLLLAALDEMKKSGVYYSFTGSKELAIIQRVKQIEKKLGKEE